MGDDLNDPRISAYKPQRRILLPAPPGPRRRKRNKAQRREKARADARATRMHLIGLTDAGVIIMGLAVVAVIIATILTVAMHH